MTSDATDNTMRAEFEAWLVSLEGAPNLGRDEAGYYAVFGTEMNWRAWQAARADTARQVAEAVAAEREACAEIAKRYGEQKFFSLSVEHHIRARTASQYSKPDREPSEDGYRG